MHNDASFLEMSSLNTLFSNGQGRASHQFSYRTENQATTTVQCRTLLCCCRTLWLGPTDVTYISLSFPRPSSTLTSKFLRGFPANSLIWRHLLPLVFILVPSLPHFALQSALVAIEVVMSGPEREFIGRDKCFMELFSIIMLGLLVILRVAGGLVSDLLPPKAPEFCYSPRRSALLP